MATASLLDSKSVQYVPTVKERIKALRLQMLVHSYIYYVLDEQLISDHEWQRRADELAALQQRHPIRIGCYDAVFKDWDGSTGYHLPKDQWVVSKAHYILRLHQRALGTYVEPAAPIQPRRRAVTAPRRRGLFDT